MLIDNLKTFSYDGRYLSDLGAVIKQKPRQIFSLPDFNLVEIPHRSGDEIEDNSRYKNIEFKIPIIALPAFCSMTREEFARALSEWLLGGKREYKLYRDTYNNGYFRYGIVTNIEPVEEVERGVYETEIEISFKPFMYSDIGLIPMEFERSSNSLEITVMNPEPCEAEPVITITGTGTFTISINNSPNVTVISRGGFVIDKPNEDVYKLNHVSCNNNVTGLLLPHLYVGSNLISIDRSSGSGSWTAKIVPNWRRW